jgi:hypothetical protein
MPDSRLRLRPTNLADHYHFELPPDGFRPERATDEELRRYGLPHRPDPNKFPRAARLWLRCMRRVRKFTAPVLEKNPNVIHGNRVGLHDVTDTKSQPSWSGLSITNNAPYISVWGTWTVPAVSLPATVFGVSSMWVGLDDSPIPILSLLQAGTEQDCDILGSNYYAWFEWFPQPEIMVSNFPVSPGEAVAVFVGNVDEVAGGNQGLVTFFNYTTGVAAAPILVPTPTVDFNGNPISPAIPGVPTSEADWILERTSTAQNGKAVPGPLADYGEASMIEGDAVGMSTQGGKTIANTFFVGENDQGVLHQMVADDGVTIISEANEVPGLQFFYTGGSS